MRMKRLMIVMMGLVLTLSASAQYRRPYYYSPNHGHSNYRYGSPVEVYGGLRLGAAFSTVSSDDRYLNGGSMKTGLSYIEKGGEGSYNGSKFTYNLDYLEMPLLMKYKIDIDGRFSVQPFAGGYVAVGVGGKIKDFGQRQAYSSFDKEGFSRFDGGVRLGCGVQYDFLYAELGYDIGLANISHDYFDTSRTGSLFATIGVNF